MDWANALVEMSEATRVAPSDILSGGILTPQIHAETSEFSILLEREPYKGTLESTGLRTRAPGLQGGDGAVQADGRETAAGTADLAQVARRDTASLAGAAARLDNLRNYRDQARELNAEIARIENAQKAQKKVGGPGPFHPRELARKRGIEACLKRLERSKQGFKATDYETTRFSLSEGELERAPFSDVQGREQADGEPMGAVDRGSGDPVQGQYSGFEVVSSQMEKGLETRPVNPIGMRMRARHPEDMHTFA